jgi:hypothetical protein
VPRTGALTRAAALPPRLNRVVAPSAPCPVPHLARAVSRLPAPQLVVPRAVPPRMLDVVLAPPSDPPTRLGAMLAAVPGPPRVGRGSAIMAIGRLPTSAAFASRHRRACSRGPLLIPRAVALSRHCPP